MENLKVCRDSFATSNFMVLGDDGEVSGTVKKKDASIIVTLDESFTLKTGHSRAILFKRDKVKNNQRILFFLG